MVSENVLKVQVNRHVFDTERPFSSVLDGIFGGISQPDIGLLFSKLAASTSYEGLAYERPFPGRAEQVDTALLEFLVG